MDKNCFKMYKISDEVKVFQENNGKLESGIDSKRKRLSCVENLERYLPGRCAVTITICDHNEATLSHTKEMRRGIQTY